MGTFWIECDGHLNKHDWFLGFEYGLMIGQLPHLHRWLLFFLSPPLLLFLVRHALSTWLQRTSSANCHQTKLERKTSMAYY